MELPSSGSSDPRLPRGVWRYQVDVAPRQPLEVQINGGIASGSFREALLVVDHPDFNRGKRDLADLFIWGDVDPNFHPKIGPTFSFENPLPFEHRTGLLLSAGAGLKTINVRARFRSGRTIDGSASFTLLDDVPHVSILQQPRRSHLPASSAVVLEWSCSHSVSQIYVGLTTSAEAPRSECAVLTSGVNVNTSGSWAAGERIFSGFSYADALAASQAMDHPLDVTGQVFVKIFAVTPRGETS